MQTNIENSVCWWWFNQFAQRKYYTIKQGGIQGGNGGFQIRPGDADIGWQNQNSAF